MEIIFEKYSTPESFDKITKKIEQLIRDSDLHTQENLRKIYSLIDLTSLNTHDTTQKIIEMCQKINNFHDYQRFVGIYNVAAICIFPNFIPTVVENLHARNVKIASVSAAFPSAQTFKEVKLQETKLAIESGVDEIDIVMPLSLFFEEKYQEVFEEIAQIKDLLQDKHLKVIIETELLEKPELVKKASIIALEAGADFIKTSTGKLKTGATPEAFYIMAQTVNEFNQLYNKKTGVKAAGGIATSTDAIVYFAIVKNILGKDWLNPELFRIGASRLANNLLNEIYEMSTNKISKITYF